MKSNAQLPDSIHAFCAGSDPCEDIGLMQQRLALLGKVVFLIAVAFFVVGVIITTSLGFPLRAMLAESSTKAHLTGASVMGLLGVVCSRHRKMSLRVLGWLEIGSLIACCTAWALMLGQIDQPATVMLALMLTVIARAVIVPSTAMRTLWLTLVASVPLLIVTQLRFDPPHIPELSPWVIRLLHTVDKVMWVAAFTATATVASRIIYGLAREVAAARDIGQYTLEERIGSGGMGEVWRATHRMLIRPAAIKIISRAALGSSPGGPELLLRRFEREARTTAALRSQHTVQLYDFGVTDDGGLYYVMELLDGLDLDTLVQRHGPVPAERVVHILVQACRSLAEAHAAALVHRDIKPANLFILRAGAEVDVVKVLDFGLVKLGQTKETERSLELTGTGSMPGTPTFMAPELVLGEKELDHRADLYSLGCVAYWLLTGQHVFQGETAVKVMLDHVHTAPAPPSSRCAQPIPAALEQLILACLAKDPADRPQTAVALGDQLEAIQLATPWTSQRAREWWQAHEPETEAARPLADVLRSREVERPALRVARRE
jgi:hypothetical protein